MLVACAFSFHAVVSARYRGAPHQYQEKSDNETVTLGKRSKKKAKPTLDVVSVLAASVCWQCRPALRWLPSRHVPTQAVIRRIDHCNATPPRSVPASPQRMEQSAGTALASRLAT
jgi:hypothetical protein